MSYHITVTLNQEIESHNIKQLRNRSKWHTGGADAGNFKAGKATVVKKSPRQAVVKLNTSVNRKQARKIGKSLGNARNVKRLEFEQI